MNSYFHCRKIIRGGLAILPLILFILLSGCNNSQSNNPVTIAKDTIPRNIEITAASIAGNFSSQTRLKGDTADWINFFKKYSALRPFEKNMLNFYRDRNFTFAWHDDNGMIEQAGNLYNRLQHLQQEGLPEKPPYLEVLDSLMSDATDERDPKVQTETDVLLTGLYFYFADKVWGGLDEKQTRKINWYLPRKKVDYELWLDSLLQTPDAFAGPDEPVYRQYRLLKPFLDKYRKLSAQHNWEPIKADKKSYKPGDSSAVLLTIRARLVELGDAPSNNNSAVFDQSLESAVKNFQRRFGMNDDGVIGAQMLRELNVPLSERIQQISVNLERSRWLPYEATGEYLAVNIPEFKLHAFNGDSLLWDMNVVVGKSVHKTVIFSGDLKYVVFSPYWNVPTSILKKEVLPGIRRNKNYLANHHMEWNGNSVRQKPGPWNSLGQVKFLFPNSFSIYLHDTPSKSLFKEDNRAFSHGCIRVAEPKKLAMFLLRNDPNWNETKIVNAMNSGKEQYVTLKQSVPVFIAYFTAWVETDGRLNFRKDIYNRDNRLAEMIGDENLIGKK